MTESKEVLVRKRRSREEFQQLMMEHESSGLRQNELSRKLGLALSTLQRQLKKRRLEHRVRPNPLGANAECFRVAFSFAGERRNFEGWLKISKFRPMSRRGRSRESLHFFGQKSGYAILGWTGSRGVVTKSAQLWCSMILNLAEVKLRTS